MAIPVSLDAASKAQPQQQNNIPSVFVTPSATSDGGDAGMLQVTITRDTLGESFGFGLGETESGNHHIISKVSQGGRAAGVLKPADRVTAVNGVSIDCLTHDEVVQMLVKNTSVALVLQRADDNATKNQSGSSDLGKEAELAVRAAASLRRHTEDAASVAPQAGGDLTTVILERPSLAESFGVGFKAGKGPTDPAYVSAIKEGTVAHSRLSKGDKIIKVNGVQTAGQDHAKVAEYFRSTLVVELLILPTANFEMVDATITRPNAGVSFGFSIGQLFDGGELVVTKSSPNTPAAGKLQVNDVVISINGTSVAFGGDASKDATDLCRTSGDSIQFLVRRKVV
jgi:C-terminal processing protease CtpA/Prc